MLEPVFGMADPLQAVEWAKLGVYESVCEPWPRRGSLSLTRREALRGPPDESGEL